MNYYFLKGHGILVYAYWDDRIPAAYQDYFKFESGYMSPVHEEPNELMRSINKIRTVNFIIALLILLGLIFLVALLLILL